MIEAGEPTHFVKLSAKCATFLLRSSSIFTHSITKPLSLKKFAEKLAFYYTRGVEEEKKQEKDALTKSDLISFAFEVGGSIALPLVILALGGRLLDKYFDSSPLFLILGLLLSLISTAYLISKKVKKFSNF